MLLETGQQVGHYRVVRQIGQGGMGEVYLAEDATLKRRVALKVLPASMSTDPARLERFQREAEAIAALNHPNIVTIHSVEDHGGMRFLTMELVEGESLDRKVTPGGMSLADVFDIGTSVADALSAAHEKGIVHRDLKPANVMLTKDGRVKVLDFGLVKLAAGSEPNLVSEEATRNASLTGEGMVVGTAPYMSPEQLSGKDVDHRTDIFSLGVMLYELAVGRRPFGGNSSAELTSSIMRDTPRPVNEMREDLPRHLGRIIAHCLEKDPEARLQSAKDIRNELRGLRREIESGASGESRTMPAAQAPTTAPSGSSPMTASASTPSAVAADAGGARQWLWAVGGAVVAVALGAVFWLGRSSQGPAPGATTEVNAASTASPGGAAAVPETSSLAVLPFTNMSSDKEQEYFSDGLTEELLNALVKIPELKVSGRTSSFSFKGRNEDLRTIAEKLGVANILEGSVRKSGNRVRITAQLVKAADGFHLWSETYDRTLDDIFAVQDDIAKAVARALQVTLLGKGAAAQHPDAEAYDLILKARYVLQIRTEESIRRARAMLEQALRLSPDYAPAWGEMGIVHTREVERGTTVEARRQAHKEALEAFARALELDPGLAVTHSRMAITQTDSWEFEEAERSTERAFAAEPKNPMVLVNAGILYSSLGKFDKAISLLEQGGAADPLNVTALNNLTNVLLIAGRLDQAALVSRKALEMRPDSEVAHVLLGTYHLLRGEAEEARTAFGKYVELAGLGDYGRIQFEALVEHTAGNAEGSKKAATEFEKRFGEEDPYSCAGIRAWRGEGDAAFVWLDKALAARDPALSNLKMEFSLQPLHSDPRWNLLLKKVGLPAD